MKNSKDYTWISFVTTPDVKAWLEQQAKNSERNVSQYIRLIINKEMREQKNGRKDE